MHIIFGELLTTETGSDESPHSFLMLREKERDYFNWNQLKTTNQITLRKWNYEISSVQDNKNKYYVLIIIMLLMN